MRRLKESIFLGLCGGVVVVCGVVRALHPSMQTASVDGEEALTADSVQVPDSLLPQGAVPAPVSPPSVVARPDLPKLGVTSDGRRQWHRVRSVPSYAKCFPDVQEVQIKAAEQWGVTPVANRADAEQRKAELVYIGASPFFCLDSKMHFSIPYLVPRAYDLLSDIGRNYMDSLYVKGIPLHRIIVSSVLRTEEDVRRLRRGNGNATSQSCHRYGTTVDICYNRFSTVSRPGEPERRTVSSDTLKWVLSEVLRDMRQQGRCYVKYEVKQGCFHLTVR